MIESHDLVGYQSMGQNHSLQLDYSSQSADASSILNFGWEDVGAELRTYASSPQAKLTDAGNVLLTVQVTYTGKGGTLTGATQYFSIPPSIDDFSVAIQTDLSALPTGYYAYTIAANFAGKDRSTSGAILHVNGADSAFGRGWNMAGLQDLYVDDDGSITLIDGNGAGQHFDRMQLPQFMQSSCAAGTIVEEFSTVDGDASEFVKLDSGLYQRTLRDGSVYTYTPSTVDANGKVVAGKLQTVVDRYGNTTRYDWDPAGHVRRSPTRSVSSPASGTAATR